MAQRGLAAVTFQPYQPREALAQSLSAADVHLISLQPALEGLVVPSKIYGVMAAGRPGIFIGDADGEVARVLAQHRCGRVVAQGDPHGLARAIREMAVDETETEAMGQRARQAFEAEFDKPHAVGRWASLVRELCDAGGVVASDAKDAPR